MPNYIPNYYRGASKQFPRTAGRSSLLFNTGTVHWIYRSLIEGLLGLNFVGQGVHFAPQPPSHLNRMQARKHIAGVTFNMTIERTASVTRQETKVDGVLIANNVLTPLESGKEYQVHIQIPTEA